MRRDHAAFLLSTCLCRECPTCHTTCSSSSPWLAAFNRASEIGELLAQSTDCALVPPHRLLDVPLHEVPERLRSRRRAVGSVRRDVDGGG